MFCSLLWKCTADVNWLENVKKVKKVCMKDNWQRVKKITEVLIDRVEVIRLSTSRKNKVNEIGFPKRRKLCTDWLIELLHKRDIVCEWVRFLRQLDFECWG